MSLCHTINQARVTLGTKCNANSACHTEIEIFQADGNFGLNRHGNMGQDKII